MDPAIFHPIGVVHSTFTDAAHGVPRQAAGAMDEHGEVEIFKAYREGLRDLQGYSHLVVIFHLHRVDHAELISHPPWDDTEHGVFATCSPFRPNPIGVSVVELEELDVQSGRLAIAGIDMADGSPVLDIKPYIPSLYPRDAIAVGWMKGKVHCMTGSRSGDRP